MTGRAMTITAAVSVAALVMSLPLAAQQRMHSAQPCRAVLSLDAGHMPFLSQPEKLAQHLTSLALTGVGS